MSPKRTMAVAALVGVMIVAGCSTEAAPTPNPLREYAEVVMALNNEINDQLAKVSDAFDAGDVSGPQWRQALFDLLIREAHTLLFLDRLPRYRQALLDKDPVFAPLLDRPLPIIQPITEANEDIVFDYLNSIINPHVDLAEDILR